MAAKVERDSHDITFHLRGAARSLGLPNHRLPAPQITPALITFPILTKPVAATCSRYYT
jgi:hypothetical protein